MIQLVALDMAGTTVDEHGNVYRALEDAVRETGAGVAAADLQSQMGAEKSEAIATLIGLGGGNPESELVARTFDRFRELLAYYYVAQQPVGLPGVVEAMRELKAHGVKVALTTGFSRDVVDLLLSGLGWETGPGELLDAVVSSDEVARGRPAPYMIHRAMERTGVMDVSQVVAVGDTVNDLRAATNAGVVAVGVLTGKLGRDELGAHPHSYLLNSAAELPDAILAESGSAPIR